MEEPKSKPRDPPLRDADLPVDDDETTSIGFSSRQLRVCRKKGSDRLTCLSQPPLRWFTCLILLEFLGSPVFRCQYGCHKSVMIFGSKRG